MTTNPKSLSFRDNPPESRYELRDGEDVLAFAQYRAEDGWVTFTHTEVRPEHEHQGLGGELARRSLDEVRSRGAQVVPACAFIAAYVRRNPEYADLLRERRAQDGDRSMAGTTRS
jgi:uncharacterized protein